MQLLHYAHVLHYMMMKEKGLDKMNTEEFKIIKKDKVIAVVEGFKEAVAKAKEMNADYVENAEGEVDWIRRK